MPRQARRKDHLVGKFQNLLHDLVPRRSKSTSPNRPISPTALDLQASSAPVGAGPTLIHGIPDAQPPNETSLSNIYPSIVIDPAGDESPGPMANLAGAGFQGLKMTLRLVERASDVFTPLKSAVAGLLGIIDIMEVRDIQVRL